jgi:hypothetical protein
VNPPVVVGDAASRVLLVVVEVWRQDHRLGLRWWLGASHANRLAGLSSVTPSVLDCPPNEQPPGNVEERQAASLCFRSHDSNYLCDPFWLLALVWPPCVHFCRLCAAGTGRRWLNAKTLQQFG